LKVEPRKLIEFYIDQGFSLIPIVRDRKAPAVEWERYQRERATLEQVLAWWDAGHDLAVVCGAVSGNLVVVDFDEPKLYHKVYGKGKEKETLVVLTSRSGRDRRRHVYGRTSWPIPTKHLKHKGLAIDIQGEGAYVKLPPSARDLRAGVYYEPERFDRDTTIEAHEGDFLEDFIQLLKDTLGFEHAAEFVSVSSLFKPADEGTRHHTLIRLASWLKHCKADREIALAKTLKWDESCRPPQGEAEVRYQFDSVWDREEAYTYKFDQPPREIYPEDIVRDAESILSDGDPFGYAVETIHMIHAGDDLLICLEWCSLLGSWLEGVKLNTHAIGESGSGKSHLKLSILDAMPSHLFQIFTSSSPLSMFYYIKEYGEDALDGVLIYLDEVEASQETLPMLRSLTSQTKITPRHLTVQDQNLIDLRIKGRRAMWFTSVRVMGSDQIQNRFIHTTPDSSVEQDLDVFLKQDKIQRRGEVPDERPLKVFGAMTELVISGTQDLGVEIPFWITWPFIAHRRLYPMFISTIKCVVRARWKQREIKDRKIVAEPGDFELARRMWLGIEKSIIFRVAGRPMRVYHLLPEEAEDAMTHYEISQALGISTSQVKRDCGHLMDQSLISSRKREAVGRGQRAWEYWRVPPLTLLDMSIVETEEEMLEYLEGLKRGKRMHDQSPQKRESKNANDMQFQKLPGTDFGRIWLEKYREEEEQSERQRERV